MSDCFDPPTLITSAESPGLAPPRWQATLTQRAFGVPMHGSSVGILNAGYLSDLTTTFGLLV